MHRQRPISLLTDARMTPDLLARHLLDRGVDWFAMHVFEHMGSDGEQEHHLTLAEAAAARFGAVCTVLLTPAGEMRRPHPGLLPAELRHEDGLLTKPAVRAAALALLRPEPRHTVWDLGAGSGSVALEAACLAHEGRVVAVERTPSRALDIQENRRRFGAASVDVCLGTVPQCLPRLPDPHRVFIGGGLSGICAARRAVELGNSVIVIENDANYDIHGFQCAALNPDLFRREVEKNGEKWEDYKVDELDFVRNYMNMHNNRCNFDIVKLWAAQSGKAFDWYEELPLAGWKVLVTRPKELVSRTADKLREKGAEVLELPAIRTVPMEDQSRLYEAMDHLENYQWLVFTSPTGVRVFFEELVRHGKDIRAMGKIRLAVIGEGTKKALKERGLLADFVPSVYDGDTLGKELSEILSGGEKILIPRAEKGNEKLTEFLAQAGAEVEDIPTYQTLYEKSQLIDEKKEFETGQISCAVFTSASTVKGFVEGTKGLDYSKVKAACIGRQTKAAAESFGMKAYMSEKATIDSLVKLVEDMKRSE